MHYTILIHMFIQHASHSHTHSLKSTRVESKVKSEHEHKKELLIKCIIIKCCQCKSVNEGSILGHLKNQ